MYKPLQDHWHCTRDTAACALSHDWHTTLQHMKYRLEDTRTDSVIIPNISYFSFQSQYLDIELNNILGRLGRVRVKRSVIILVHVLSSHNLQFCIGSSFGMEWEDGMML